VEAYARIGVPYEEFRSIFWARSTSAFKRRPNVREIVLKSRIIRVDLCQSNNTDATLQCLRVDVSLIQSCNASRCFLWILRQHPKQFQRLLLPIPVCCVRASVARSSACRSLFLRGCPFAFHFGRFPLAAQSSRQLRVSQKIAFGPVRVLCQALQFGANLSDARTDRPQAKGTATFQVIGCTPFRKSSASKFKLFRFIHSISAASLAGCPRALVPDR